MRNIKIVYQYDGSKYYGFQRQKNKDTVQGDIEKIVFSKFSVKGLLQDVILVYNANNPSESAYRV